MRENSKSQEQENTQMLEVKNEFFEHIMRSHAIEVNEMQRDVKRGKRESKKKQLENRKLKDGNKKT